MCPHPCERTCTQSQIPHTWDNKWMNEQIHKWTSLLAAVAFKENQLLIKMNDRKHMCFPALDLSLTPYHVMTQRLCEETHYSNGYKNCKTHQHSTTTPDAQFLYLFCLPIRPYLNGTNWDDRNCTTLEIKAPMILPVSTFFRPTDLHLCREYFCHVWNKEEHALPECVLSLEKH